MKRFLTLVVLFLLAVSQGVRADSPDDQYVVIYSLIQQADALNDRGQSGPAAARYQEVQAMLKKFQEANPDWNPNVVSFRLNYVASRIARLSAGGAAAKDTNAPAPAGGIQPPPSAVTIPPPATNGGVIMAPATPAPPAPPAAPVVPAAPEADPQVLALQDQVRRLESERALLQAKLKEALAAQPAALDPQQLVKAEDQIKALEKENEALKASLAESKTNRAPASPAGTDEAQKALADANSKVAALTEANAELALEKAALQSRVKTLSAPDEASLALRTENEILKKQVAELKNQNPPATRSDLNRQLLEAQAQIAALQSDKEILRLEKTALESQSRRLAAGGSAAPPAVKAAAAAGQADEIAGQLASLRARVQVYEAKAVPYTADELALFKLPPATLVASAHASAAVASKEPPPGSEALLADAKRFFIARQFDKVEEKYLQVLKLDEKNVSTLTHLATVQLELNHFDDADKNLKQALALDPDNAYGLGTLGRLRFQQARYDDALEALSRAVQLNPDNPEFQNYLGITLSHKGLRGPAETALRKAIQIDPKFAPAHNNLAVIYITQDPPLVELARWHYQKAVAAGHPTNPELEKLLEKPAKP